MPYYPPVEEVRRRLESALATIADRYKMGVQGAKWQEPTLAQAANYYAALDRIKAEDKYRKGVTAASDEDWRKGAVEKGAPVLPVRLRAALPKWEAAWAPKYRAVIETAQRLPPRTPDFEANIETRLKPIVRAWKGLTR